MYEAYLFVIPSGGSSATLGICSALELDTEN